MTQITKEHLAFVEKAKEEFDKNPKYETYRNEDNSLIALRVGEARDCILVYEMKGLVANFVEQVSPTIVNWHEELSADESRHFSVGVEW